MVNPIGVVVKLLKRKDKTSPITIMPYCVDYVVQHKED